MDLINLKKNISLINRNLQYKNSQIKVVEEKVKQNKKYYKLVISYQKFKNTKIKNFVNKLKFNKIKIILKK